MLSIFVEASCNRYERDECASCHVFEPLKDFPKDEWHTTPEQARIMADKIGKVEVLSALAQQEINLTGGEASQNPHIVDIFKIFKTVSDNVCLHTNLDINSDTSKRWLRLVEIVKLSGRIDITLYPTAWEVRQKHLLEELLKIQDRILVNVVFENLPDLKNQIELLLNFFISKEDKFQLIVQSLQAYYEKISSLLASNPNCIESEYTQHMGEIGAFTKSKEFTFGINLLPAFTISEKGHRTMTSNPFPKDNYLLECVAARGAIDIMTVQQNGDMTPCCDVGNLKCLPTFGNLLKDSPEQIMDRFEKSRRTIEAGIITNKKNISDNKAGEWVEEGIPPYCV